MYKHDYGLWHIECKSVKDASLTYNKECPYEAIEGKTFKIRPHQVKSLMEFSQHKGVYCGFIINFRPKKTVRIDRDNECYFVEINDFLDFAENSKKGTLGYKDVKRMGALIKNRKKKVNYHYYIDDFVKKYIMKRG